LGGAQDKNCLGLPRLSAAWAGGSGSSNVVPAPYELKPRLPHTNVYLAVGHYIRADDQGLEEGDQQALFGAAFKAARATVAAVANTFRPHATVGEVTSFQEAAGYAFG
jgi:hypothetical protein